MVKKRYHDKEHTHASTFKHNRQHEMRMYRLKTRYGLGNKSELNRKLIDDAYERDILKHG